MKTSAIFVALLMAGCVGEAPAGGDDEPEPDPTPPMQPTTPQLESVAGGSFRAMGTYSGIGGRALMVRRLDGQTYLSMSVTGVALSIVVHDPNGGAKMACADLIADEPATSVVFSDAVAPFAAATTADMTVTGSLEVSRTSTASTFTLKLEGLVTNAIGYDTHI